MKIGIIGCGNIASLLHECLEEVEVLALYDRHIERAEAVAAKTGAQIAPDFETFMQYPLDLVVEAASVEAAAAYARPLLEKGCELALLSSGALADPQLRRELERTARTHGATLHIPSGALFGLDNAVIGKVGGIERIRMKTLKPPRSLHVEVEKATCLFKGGAFECIRHFPKNANAAVSLSLAAGVETKVEVWADPQRETIRHEVVMEGSFGTVTIAIDNTICPHNPSTSYLAVLSVCALLRSLNAAVQFGS